jgi:hydrophobic/amphiphilic exporter-1 (mainly G- bacteria), HAE1 family
MNIVDLSIKRPIMISMGLIACVIFGVMAYFKLPQSLLPTVTLPYVTVQTTYAGASPEVIETQVSKKIEDQVSAISGLDEITSYSMDNVSIVTISFQYGTDENIALQNVKDKVDAIASVLPADADKPVISKIDTATAMPVMSIMLEGDMPPAELYEFATTTVTDRFGQVNGVGSVNVSGGTEREIQVAIDRSTVYERAVPVSQISGILAAANLDMPGGNFTYDNRDIPVQLKGKFTSIDQIKNMDVPTQTGIYKLRQLGEIKDTVKVARIRTTLLDKKAGTRNDNAILLEVVKNPSANTISVVDGIQKQLPVIEQLSGGHAHFKVIKEDASFVRDSVNDTLSNVYLGIIFTGLVLLLFLHDIRSTLIVALAMPFSIIATFLVMQWMGIGLNMISLMGLSSSTGTLVSNSVVVLENIFRYKQQGLDRKSAAAQGTKEVIVAVFASTLTNIAVFVPLGSMKSVMGQYLVGFAYTIVIATVFSIIVSFTLTPLMASRILPEKVKKNGPVGTALDAAFARIEQGYKNILQQIIKNKKRSRNLIIATVVVFIVSMALFTKLPFELMSKTDGGKIQLSTELPQGNDLESTALLLKTIEDRVAEYPEVMTVETILGSLGTTNQDVSVAQMNIFLTPRGERKLSNTAIAGLMTKQLSDIPGAKIRVSALSEMGSGSSSGDIDLYLKGSDTVQLQQYADAIQTTMNHTAGLSNVSLSSKSGKRELDFIPDRKQLAADGLSVQDIAVTLRCAIDGLVSTAYKDGGNEYDIRVKISGTSLNSLEDIRNIPVASKAGVYPISRYAQIDFADATNKIMRVGKVETIEITADVLEGYSSGVMTSKVIDDIHAMNLPAGYTIEQGGMSKMLGDTVSQMITVFIIAILLTYMLLAATLENLLQPLFILSTVPLSLIGVVLICLGTGTVMNMMAMLGIIMLVGIVVNNAILMLDYYNQLRATGKSVTDSMLEAFPAKLKAILMSNIAIILGMLPMAMGIGSSGAEMRIPMGMVIIGGIVSSTILTLFLLPALEYLTARKNVKKQAVIV